MGGLGSRPNAIGTADNAHRRCRQQQRRRGGDIDDPEAERSKQRRQQIHHHVAGKPDATAGLLDQPALDDRRQPAEAKAGDHPKPDPGPVVGKQWQQGGGAGRDQRKTEKRADMAETAEHLPDTDAGQHEAHRPACREQADQHHTGATLVAEQRQQHPLQVGAEHQEHDGDKQRTQ